MFGCCCAPSIDASSEVEVRTAAPGISSGNAIGLNQTAEKDELKWLNFALLHVWTELQQQSKFIVDELILPAMEKSVPKHVKSISMKSFSFGKAPVVVGPVEVTKLLCRGALRIRAHFEYISDMQMEAEIETSLKKFNVGIKNLSLVGIAVFKILPYIDNRPGTAGVTFFFLNTPTIDFAFTGDLAALNWPGLKEFILQGITNAISGKMVLPDVVTVMYDIKKTTLYPIMFQEVPPIGMCRVTFMDIAVKHNSASSTTTNTFAETRRARTFRDRWIDAKAKMHQLTEWVDDGIGSLIGSNTKPYLTMALAHDEWKLELSDKNASYDFVVQDPQQEILISLWDRDVNSADDRIAEIPPMTLSDAVSLSGKTLGFSPLEDHTLSSNAQGRFKFEFFLANPSRLGKFGGVVNIRVNEIRSNGTTLRGKCWAVKAAVACIEKSTPDGKQMREPYEHRHAQAAIEKARENLKKLCVAEDIIAESLTLVPESTRIAFNHTICFSLLPAVLDTAKIELMLVEMQPRKEVERGASRKQTVIGTFSTSTSALKNCPDMNMSLVTFQTSFGDVEGNINIFLSGYFEGNPPPVDSGTDEVIDSRMSLHPDD